MTVENWKSWRAVPPKVQKLTAHQPKVAQLKGQKLTSKVQLFAQKLDFEHFSKAPETSPIKHLLTFFQPTGGSLNYLPIGALLSYNSNKNNWSRHISRRKGCVEPNRREETGADF